VVAAVSRALEIRDIGGCVFHFRAKVAMRDAGVVPETVFRSVFLSLQIGLYRISALAPAGIWHFFQIRQKSGSGKNPTGAG